MESSIQALVAPPPTNSRNLEGSTHHTPRQASRHERKAKEEDQPRLPRHASSTVRIRIGAQPCFLDRVDDQHAKTRADARYPVHELDIDVGAIAKGGAEGCGVDEEEEPEGELRWRTSA